MATGATGTAGVTRLTMEPLQFGQERRQLILDEVRVRGSARVNDLAERLGVSAVTIRRDIGVLAQQGLLTRVHGGAVGRRAVERPATATIPAPRGRRTLGIVTPSMDYFWPKVVNGIQAAANAYRGQLILRSSSYSLDDDRAQMQRLLETGRAEGLLVAPVPLMPASTEVLTWLDSIGLPVVLMERTVPPDVFPGRLEWVSSDHHYSAALAVSHLASLGHRRIGLLTSLGTPHHAVAREAWARTCRNMSMDTEGVVCEDTPGFSTTNREDLLDGIIERCLSSRTTAVIVHADNEAIALLQRCQDLGVSVPGDLSIIAHDDEIASLPNPALTAIRPSKHQIGYEAASLMFRRLADPGLPLHRVLVCPELAIRRTTGAPRP